MACCHASRAPRRHSGNQGPQRGWSGCRHGVRAIESGARCRQGVEGRHLAHRRCPTDPVAPDAIGDEQHPGSAGGGVVHPSNSHQPSALMEPQPSAATRAHHDQTAAQVQDRPASMHPTPPTRAARHAGGGDKAPQPQLQCRMPRANATRSSPESSTNAAHSSSTSASTHASSLASSRALRANARLAPP